MKLSLRLNGGRKRAIFAPICIVAARQASPVSRRQEREIAIKAARTMALDVAGVDILRANRGPLVMEVNASPGLEGIEKTTGIDIAGKMIRWIERHATAEYCLKTGG